MNKIIRNVPYTGDIIYCNDIRSKYYGKRGKIIFTEEDWNFSSYGCGYYYTVQFDDIIPVIHLTNNQVSYFKPKSLKKINNEKQKLKEFLNAKKEIKR